MESQGHRNLSLRSHRPVRENPPPPSLTTTRRPHLGSHSQLRGGQVFTSPNPTQQLNSFLDSSSHFQPQVTLPSLPHPSKPAHSNPTKTKSLPRLLSPVYRSQSPPSSPLLVGCSPFIPRKERRKSDIPPCPNRRTSLTDFSSPLALAFKLNHKTSSNSLNSNRLQLHRILSKVTNHNEKKSDSNTSSTAPLKLPEIQHLHPPTNSPPTWQSSLRCQNTFLKLEQRFGPTEIKRQEVIWELIQTESSYIQDLKLIISFFSQPHHGQSKLNHHSPTWSPTHGVPPQFSNFIQNVYQILILHEAIHISLEATRQWNHGLVILSISESYLRFIDRFKGVYQEYIERFDKTNKLIDQVFKTCQSDGLNSKKNKFQISAFGLFLRNQPGPDQLTQLRLNSFLLKPVQRLMKYPLFFKQLCELTPPTHPDHKPTLTVWKSIDALINELEEFKIREEQNEYLESSSIRDQRSFSEKRSMGRLGHQQPPRLQKRSVTEPILSSPLKLAPRSAFNHQSISASSVPSHYARSSELRNPSSPTFKASSSQIPDDFYTIRSNIKSKLSCVNSTL